MRAFYSAYAETQVILSQLVTESPQKKLSQPATVSVSQPPDFVADLPDLPWGHNQVLLFKVKEMAERLW